MLLDVRTLVAVRRWDDRAVTAAVACTRARPRLARAAVAWDAAFTARRVNLVAVPAVIALGGRGVTTVLASWLLQSVVKGLVRRPRPDVAPLVPVPGTSTPSGHVANLTTAALILHDLAGTVLPRRATRAVALGLGLVVALTALDRVAVGAHRPSDVLAGAALGLAVHAASRRLTPPLPDAVPPRPPDAVGPGPLAPEAL